MIAVTTATETLRCSTGEADRHSFKVKCFDSFVFPFYSETIRNDASEIFALDPCCSEGKCFLIWTEIWTLLYGKRKKKKTLCVNSSMNLITAVCARIEWEEHSWPVDQTETTFLVELVSCCHSIHVLTYNKIKQRKKKNNTHKGNSSMDVFMMPDLWGLQSQFLDEQDFKMGSKQSLLTPRSSFQCSPTSQVVHHCTHAHHRESHHSASRRSNSDSHVLLQYSVRPVDVHHQSSIQHNMQEKCRMFSERHSATVLFIF